MFLTDDEYYCLYREYYFPYIEIRDDIVTVEFLEMIIRDGVWKLSRNKHESRKISIKCKWIYIQCVVKSLYEHIPYIFASSP